MPERGEQSAALFLCHGIYLLRRGNAAARDDNGYHLCGEQVAERICKILVFIFFKIAHYAAVERLLIESGLHIYLDGKSPRSHRPHMSRGGEHRRSAYAEMSEEQLSEIAVDNLAAFIIYYGDADVLQCQTLHRGAGAVAAAKPDKRGHKRLYRMSRLRGEAVSVARRAGHGIGRAARGYYHAVKIREGAFIRHYRGNALFAALTAQLYIRHSLREYRDAQSAHFVFESEDDISRLVGNGENPVSALRFQRYAEPLGKEGFCAFAVKAAYRGKEKFPVCRDIPHKFLGCAVVCQIASALARDAELAPEKSVPLENRDRGTAVGGKDGGAHSCRTCTYYGNFPHLFFSVFSVL